VGILIWSNQPLLLPRPPGLKGSRSAGAVMAPGLARGRWLNVDFSLIGLKFPGLPKKPFFGEISKGTARGID
jgi:hypothetical protein